MTGGYTYCKAGMPSGGREGGRPAAAGMMVSVALHLLAAAALMLLWGASGGVRHADLITVALAPEPVAAPVHSVTSAPERPGPARPPSHTSPAAPAAAPAMTPDVRETNDETRETEAADSEVDEVREHVETPAPGGEREPDTFDVAVPAGPRERAGGEAIETASITGPVPASGMSGSCCGPEAELRALKDEYAGKLKELIERFVDYPVFARRARLEGTCMLVCRISAAGELLGVDVEKSAGHDVLDRAAVDAVRDAGRFPPVPYMDGEGVLDVSVPVNFSLDGRR